MMTTKEFIQYASERPELCEKLSACTAPEEVYTLAQGEGLSDDMATFIAVMEDVKKEAEALSDKDLDGVVAAAGVSTQIIASVATATSAAICVLL